MQHYICVCMRVCVCLCVCVCVCIYIYITPHYSSIVAHVKRTQVDQSMMSYPWFNHMHGPHLPNVTFPAQVAYAPSHGRTHYTTEQVLNSLVSVAVVCSASGVGHQHPQPHALHHRAVPCCQLWTQPAAHLCMRRVQGARLQARGRGDGVWGHSWVADRAGRRV